MSDKLQLYHREEHLHHFPKPERVPAIPRESKWEHCTHRTYKLLDSCLADYYLKDSINNLLLRQHFCHSTRIYIVLEEACLVIASLP